MILSSIAYLKEINEKFEKGTSNLNKDCFTFITQIGSGAFGKVYRVSSKLTNKIYALKVLSKNQLTHLKLMDQLKNEINIFSRCHHENIIALYAAFEDQNYIYMIMELANDSNLFNKLKKQKKFNEKISADYLRDIIQALIYLHSQNPVILHRDLKPENILIHDGKCKLSDFGWSNVDDEFRNTFCGTPDYLAPEMILGSGHTEKLDIWTIGILLYELLHGKPPFSPKDKIADGRIMQKMIEKNILKGDIEFGEFLSGEAIDCIKSLLNSESSLRPSAKEILDLPFFKKYCLNAKSNEKSFSTNTTTTSSNSIDEMSEKSLRKLVTEYKTRLEILSQANKKLTGQLENSDASMKLMKKELEFEKARTKKFGEEITLLKSVDGMSDKNNDLNESKNAKIQIGNQKETMRYLFKRMSHFSSVVDEFFEEFILESQPKEMLSSYDDSLTKLQAIFRDFIRYKSYTNGKAYFNPFSPSDDIQGSQGPDPRPNRKEIRKYSPLITSQTNNTDMVKWDKDSIEFLAQLEKYFKK